VVIVVEQSLPCFSSNPSRLQKPKPKKPIDLSARFDEIRLGDGFYKQTPFIIKSSLPPAILHFNKLGAIATVGAHSEKCLVGPNKS